MPLLIPAIVCIGLFLLFPKGFRYLVGSWVGALSGGFFWGLVAMGVPALIDGTAFVSFIIAGIIAGCVLAVRG